MAGPWEQYAVAEGPWSKYSQATANAAPAKPEPSDTSVALNASSKGIAAIPDALLNTPNRIVNLVRAAFGTAATAVGRPDLAPNIKPDPNYIHRAASAMGAIRPENEPVNSRQRIIDALIQAGVGAAVAPSNSLRGFASNVATGAASGGMAGVTKEATGSDAAALLAGALTPAAIQGAGAVGRQRVADATQRRGANAVDDATRDAARQAGYVTAPSDANPSFLNNRLESFGGKSALRQEMSLRNQDVTNRLAAQELGLPPGTAITMDVLRKFRGTTSQPYRDVAALSTRSSAVFDRLQNTREQMQAAWREANGPNHPRAALNEARALTTQADALERALERVATRSGRPELPAELRHARTELAKSYDIERAMNVGNADISAPMIGRNLDRNSGRMTGNLRTIGAFAEGPGAKVVQDAAKVQSPGVSATDFMYGGGMGLAGAATLGPAGSALGAVPLLRGPARSMILSDAYQNRFAQPNYNQGSMLSRIPEQDARLQALMIARALADSQQGKKQ